MKEPPIPTNESERMELLAQLDILDTDFEEIYDGITFIAALICNTPISTITFVDKDRQWFKAIVGGKGRENPRKYSFCAYAILENRILEVPDSQKDERFKDNPLVIGDPYVRFYAGAPLELKDGLRVGTLCVIDHKPNKLNEEQLKILYYLSLQVTKLLDLRLKVKEIEELREKDAHVVNMLTHELRNPLLSISGLLSMTNQCGENSTPSFETIIDRCSKNTDRMLKIVNEFLNFSHWKDGFWELNKSRNNINTCISESADLSKGYSLKCQTTIELNLDDSLPELEFDYSSILNVLENLISNASKYSPEGAKIIIKSERKGDVIQVHVQDFGSGISDKDKEKIFKPFALYSQKNRAGIKGSGLGLSVAKKIIEKHGGDLTFESIENKGTTFSFTLPVH